MKNHVWVVERLLNDEWFPVVGVADENEGVDTLENYRRVYMNNSNFRLRKYEAVDTKG